MGFDLQVSVSAFTVLLQGFLSFFSPCVLPLLPLYIGYLAGGAAEQGEDGVIRYRRGRVMLNTCFFVLGISFAFFLLGFGFTALGQFFSSHQIWFARIGGVFVVLFGLFQLGVFGSKTLSSEHRLPFSLQRLSMNPLVALVFGFTFSFAWTPCVGPALGSVLIMASSAKSAGLGFLLIGVYTIGFIVPFLLVGLFTGTVLTFLKQHQNVVRYTVKIGGVLLILMGLMMFTGTMNGITSYLSGPQNLPQQEGPQAVPEDEEPTQEKVKTPAPDFTLRDQYGNERSLSDYKGKVVFLNFWATWCPPCQSEMPDIQKLYEKYGEDDENVAVLGVANPNNDGNALNREGTTDEVKSFLEDRGYTFPVVMDDSGDVFIDYGVSALPTTWMIDREGNVYGYVSAPLTLDIMEDIIAQTLEGDQTDGE